MQARFALSVSVPAWTARAPEILLRPHSLKIPNLPSSAGLLVKRGDRVTAGQVIARYADDAKLQALERQAGQKRQSAGEIRDAERRGRGAFDSSEG